MSPFFIAILALGLTSPKLGQRQKFKACQHFKHIPKVKIKCKREVLNTFKCIPSLGVTSLKVSWNFGARFKNHVYIECSLNYWKGFKEKYNILESYSQNKDLLHRLWWFENNHSYTHLKYTHLFHISLQSDLEYSSINASSIMF